MLVTTVRWVGLVDLNQGSLMLSRSWCPPLDAVVTEDGDQACAASYHGPSYGLAVLERSKNVWEVAKDQVQVTQLRRESEEPSATVILVRSVKGVVVVIAGMGLSAELELFEGLSTLIEVCETVTENKLCPDSVRSNSAKIATCIDEMINHGLIQFTNAELILKQSNLGH